MGECIPNQPGRICSVVTASIAETCTLDSCSSEMLVVPHVKCRDNILLNLMVLDADPSVVKAAIAIACHEHDLVLARVQLVANH